MSDLGNVDEIRKIKVNQPSSGESLRVDIKRKPKEKGNKRVVLMILATTVLVSLFFRFWETMKTRKVDDSKKVEFRNPDKKGGVNWENF